MVAVQGYWLVLVAETKKAPDFGIGLPVPPLNESEAVRMLLHHARRELKALGMFEIKILVGII